MTWKIPKIRIAGLMAMVLVLAIAFASLRFASWTWAGWILLLAVGVLGWAILAAAYRQGASRAFWLGFAVFGWIYMALTIGTWWRGDRQREDLPTTRVLDRLFPYLDPMKSPMGGIGLPAPGNNWNFLYLDPEATSRRVRAALEVPISMPFANETPLEDVIKYIRNATTSPGMSSGIPIYVDPRGLEEEEKTMASPVTLSLEGVPLRTSLEIMLRQLDLTYSVRDGVLTITSMNTGPVFSDSDAFYNIGQCWWTLLTGVIGGCAGIYLHASRKTEPESSAIA